MKKVGQSLRRRELLALTGLSESTYKAMLRQGTLFYLKLANSDEDEDAGWAKIAPWIVFRLCIQLELGRYMTAEEAAARVFEFGMENAYASPLFALSFLDSEGNPKWVTGTPDNIARALSSEASAQTSAVIMNLGAIWRKMFERAAENDISTKHLYIPPFAPGICEDAGFSG